MSERHSKLSVSNMIEGECQECEEHTCYIWTAERKKTNFYTHTHTRPRHSNTNVLWLSTTLMARQGTVFSEFQVAQDKTGITFILSTNITQNQQCL